MEYQDFPHWRHNRARVILYQLTQYSPLFNSRLGSDSGSSIAGVIFHFLFFNNYKKAQAIGIRELVTPLAVAGILFIVGITIFSQIDLAIDTSGFTADQNTTVTGIQETVLDSLELGVIALIVLAAVVILAVLFSFGSGLGGVPPREDEKINRIEDYDKEKGEFIKPDTETNTHYDDAKKSRLWNLFKRK